MAIQRAFSANIRMMLFCIENQYYNGLKISKQQVHWLKESHLEELKDAVFQNVAEILSDMTLGPFSTFKKRLVQTRIITKKKWYLS